jgi:hypothetical protein
MRFTRSPVLALVVVSLAGCAVADPFARMTGRTGSVVVVSVREPAADGGPAYTEGAVVEARLRDASGTVVGTERGAGALRHDHLRFDRLRPGSYTIEPALRPCDGNCGYLDPRAGECMAPVEIGAATVRLRVVFRGDAPCVVTQG